MKLNPPTTIRTSVVTVNGLKFQVEVKVKANTAQTTKCYLFDAPDPEVFGLMERPPFGPRGEDGVLDSAWDAYNKLEVAIRRQVLEQVFEGKWTFSRKAGCHCGCSPGFIRKDEKTAEEFFLTILPAFEMSAK